MLTAFHTTKRNPKSKALNAVLESVWVMPPSIMHHNEVPQKVDEAENHPTAFLAGTSCLLWSVCWRGHAVPTALGIRKAGSFSSPAASWAPLTPLSLSILSPLLGLSFRILSSLYRTFQKFDILAAVLGAALQSTKYPTELQKSAALSCVQGSRCTGRSVPCSWVLLQCFLAQSLFSGGCWVWSWWFHKSLCAPRSHLCVWDLTRSPLATLIPALFFPYVRNLFGFAYNEFHRGSVTVSLPAIPPCFISSNCLSSRFPVDQQFRQIKGNRSLRHLLLLHQARGRHPVPKRFRDWQNTWGFLSAGSRIGSDHFIWTLKYFFSPYRFSNVG